MEEKKRDLEKAQKREQRQKERHERNLEKRRYKQALRKEHRYGTGEQLRWHRLDNTAHLFPVIAGEDMSNVYRIFVILNEDVDRDMLQQALDIVLPKFDGFNVRLRPSSVAIQV